MKKNKLLLKTLLFGTVSILPIVTLTSCASSVSQYGINVNVTSNYADTNADMKKTFGDFKFNNTQIIVSSIQSDANDYSKIGWTNVLVPNLSFFVSLMNLSLLDFNLANISKDNSLFNTTDDALLKEFMLASSNVLNHGRNGQIKFGIVGVNTSFKTTTVSEPGGEQPSGESKTDGSSQTVTQDENSVYAAQGQTLTVGTKTNENSNTAYYDSKLSFTISLTLGYWNSQKNEPDAGTINDIKQVQDYVSANKSWPESVKPTNAKFTLDFNYDMTIRATYAGIKDSFDKSKEQSGSTGSTLEENKEEDKPSIDTVTLSEEDYKNKKPILSVNSYTEKTNSNTTSLETGNSTKLAEITTESMSTDMQTIASLLTKFDKTKADELKSKYKNVFTLSIPSQK